jgi:hypothetical protein
MVCRISPAASLEAVRDKMKVDPPNDKGLIPTLTVTAYDNGMISLDGRPVSSQPVDAALSWLQANEVIGIAMSEFYRQFQARQKSNPTPHLKVWRKAPE